MEHYKRTAALAAAIILLVAAGATLTRTAEQQSNPAVVIAATQTPEAIAMTPAPTATPEPTPEPATPRVYENLPLDAELQEFTFWKCEGLGLDYEMVLAIMQKESGFDPQAISATDDYGIMQINQCNHERLREELGITDFLDAEQSITAGTEILGDLVARYDDPHQVLMAYNMGESGARHHWEQGTHTSSYSRDIMARRAAILEGGTT